MEKRPTQSQQDHQKLQSFVSRLDLDISKEAEYLQTKIKKAHSLIPTIHAQAEKAVLKVKDSNGQEQAYDIPILTGKGSEILFCRHYGREALGH